MAGLAAHHSMLQHISSAGFPACMVGVLWGGVLLSSFDGFIWGASPLG